MKTSSRNRFSKYDGPEEVREKLVNRLNAPSGYLTRFDQVLHVVSLAMLEALKDIEQKNRML